MSAIIAADGFADAAWSEDVYHEVVASVLEDAASNKPSAKQSPLCCVLPALPASSLSKHSAGKPVCIPYGTLLRIATAALAEGENIKDALYSLPEELSCPLATEHADANSDEVIVTSFPTNNGDTVAVGIRPAEHDGKPIAQIFCMCDSETALENLNPKGIDLTKEIQDALELIAEIARLAQLGIRVSVGISN